MFEILIDGENIKAVFSKYTPAQANEVKHNIDAVFIQCKIPSQVLLKQMAAEGISIDGYEIGTHVESRKAIDLPSSVIRTNLFRMFLSLKELLRTAETLRTGELVELRELWLSLACYLNVEATKEISEPINNVITDIETSIQPNIPLGMIKERLRNALQKHNQYRGNAALKIKVDKNSSKVISVKDKLNKLNKS